MADDDTVVVKYTATWVVEVQRNTNEKHLLDWDANDVKAATDMCDGCEWSWKMLKADEMTFSDKNSLAVWKQYRDGVLVND